MLHVDQPPQHRDRRPVDGDPRWTGRAGLTAAPFVARRSGRRGLARPDQSRRRHRASVDDRRSSTCARWRRRSCYWPLLTRGAPQGGRRPRVLGVVFLVPARAAAGRPHRQAARQAGGDELPQRRGARPPAPVGDRPRRRSGTSISNAVPSRFLHDVFASFGIRSEIIPNIVDVERFRFRRRERTAAAHSVHAKLRDRSTTCRARCAHSAWCRTAIPTPRLTLVGAGSQDDALRRLARQLRLASTSPSPDACRRTTSGATTPRRTSTCRRPTSTTCRRRCSKRSPAAVRWSRPTPAACPRSSPTSLHGLLVPCDDHQAAADAMIRLLEDAALARRVADTALDACTRYQWSSVRASVGRALSAARRVQRASPRRHRHERPRRRSARLAAMDREELRFRLTCEARKLAGRLQHSRPTRRNWDRRRCSRILDPGSGPLVRALVTACSGGDYARRASRAGRTFRTRPSPLAAAGRASRALRGRDPAAGFPQLPDAARDRADRIVAGTVRPARLPRRRARQSARLARRRRPRPPRADAALDASAVPRPGGRRPQGHLGDQPAPVLLRARAAYWLTGDRRYRERVHRASRGLAARESSAASASTGRACWSWRSARHVLDVGGGVLRSEDAEDDRTPWLVDLLVSLDRQLTHVAHNLSTYFSPEHASHRRSAGALRRVDWPSPSFARSAARARDGTQRSCSAKSRRQMRRGWRPRGTVRALPPLLRPTSTCWR